MPTQPPMLPQPPSRRGACPTLRAPMQTGDGLLARLRPLGGSITPAQFQAIAALASQYGNGQIEVTARGNLQIRGLEPHHVAPFASAVEALIAIDTGLPVETSPLAGLDPAETTDPRPIAAAIRRAADALGAPFAPKLTVIVDGGGSMPLDALPADIRLRAGQTPHAPWTISVARHHLGTVPADNAAATAATLLSMIATLGPYARGRDLDADAIRHQLALPPPPSPPSNPAAPHRPIALTDGTCALPIGLPYGAANAATLTDLARAAAALGVTRFHLAPHHRLLAICPTPADAAALQSAATALGFVTAPADPRRAISACIGSDGCASGLLAARQLAETIARAEPAFFDGSFTLHVSGCPKGCAHPAPALLTLAANPAGIGLVVAGSASAAPHLNLSAQTLPNAVQCLAMLWRDERTLEESVASCFKRLGTARIIAAMRQGQS